jgi:diadenosine tetraphosphatase ApaH/serine/threonine PP2A family protein phosphatase
MRIAVLSCIHGNIPALEAVDRDIAAAKPDRVLCLGDVVGYGAQPRECIEFVRARGWPTILGNHEAAVLDENVAEEFNPVAWMAITYTRKTVNEADRAWMKTLPETMELDGYQLAHGSTAGARPFKYVLTPQDAEDALNAATRPVVFIGHTHIALAYHRVGGTGGAMTLRQEQSQQVAPGTSAVINVGAAGQPRDKDPRAAWVLYDTVTRQADWHRVAYDIALAAQRIRDAGLPEKLAARLIEGR